MDASDSYGVAELTCESCSCILVVDATDLAVDEVGSVDRNMGPETYYHGGVELICPECGSDIEVDYDASEYPVGALNDSTLIVTGAKLSKGFAEPTVLIDQTLYDLDKQTGLCLPEERQIVTNLTLSVSDLIAAVAKNPQVLYEINPRQFEEIIAEVFDRHDFEVQLTQRTRDRGRDIIAISSALGIRTKFIIECKRYAKNRPVSVSLVRELYGTQVQEGANLSILATTSRFTTPAKEFASERNTTQWGMELKDYDDIVAWVRQTHDRIR